MHSFYVSLVAERKPCRAEGKQYRGLLHISAVTPAESLVRAERADSIRSSATGRISARSVGHRRLPPRVSDREPADAGEKLNELVAAMLPRKRRFLLCRAEHLVQFDPS